MPEQDTIPAESRMMGFAGFFLFLGMSQYMVSYGDAPEGGSRLMIRVGRPMGPQNIFKLSFSWRPCISIRADNSTSQPVLVLKENVFLLIFLI